MNREGHCSAKRRKRDPRALRVGYRARKGRPERGLAGCRQQAAHTRAANVYMQDPTIAVIKRRPHKRHAISIYLVIETADRWRNVLGP